MPALNPNAPMSQTLPHRAYQVYTLHARGPETEVGASDALGRNTECYPGGYRDGCLVIDVTGLDDGASLELELQLYDSVSNKWAPVPGADVPVITAATDPPLTVAVSPIYGDNLRLVWRPIDGAVTFTASLHCRS